MTFVTFVASYSAIIGESYPECSLVVVLLGDAPKAWGSVECSEKPVTVLVCLFVVVGLLWTTCYIAVCGLIVYDCIFTTKSPPVFFASLNRCFSMFGFDMFHVFSFVITFVSISVTNICSFFLNYMVESTFCSYHA